MDDEIYSSLIHCVWQEIHTCKWAATRPGASGWRPGSWPSSRAVRSVDIGPTSGARGRTARSSERATSTVDQGRRSAIRPELMQTTRNAVPIVCRRRRRHLRLLHSRMGRNQQVPSSPWRFKYLSSLWFLASSSPC